MQAQNARSFYESIGVAVHLRYTDTAYGKFEEIIKPRLKELGVKHIRDGVPLDDRATQAKFNDLATFGIKSTLVMDPRDLTKASDAVAIAKSMPQSVEMIEGPNELDMWPEHGAYNGCKFPDNVRQFQAELYQAIKSDPATSHLPVIGPSITQWDKEQIARLAGLPGDKNNLHLYFSPWIPEQYPIDEYFVPSVGPICGCETPRIATEMGYHNNVDDSSLGAGVPEAVCAKYLLRFFFKNFKRGIERSFIYQLIDQQPAPEFGLLRNDGTPRPSFTAIKNLLSIFNNPAAPIKSPGSLNYKLLGDMATIDQAILQETPNVYYLIIWQAVEGYNVNDKKVPTIPSRTMKIVLETPAKQALFFSPLKTAKPIAQRKQFKEVSVQIPDHPLIVKLIF